MKGIVYVIRPRNSWSMIYIGSTLKSLQERYLKHIEEFNHNKIKTTSFIIFETFKIENVIIEVLKEYEVCDRQHLNTYETLWIEKYKNVIVNKNRSFCIKKLYKKKYRKENKEKQIKRSKKYYEENKEKIAEQSKKYYEENREKEAQRNKKYREENKEKIVQRKKKYYQENKQKIAERDKKYYEENREQRKQQSNCDICGKGMRKDSILRHKRTQHI